MTRAYALLENHVIDLFNRQGHFTVQGNTYTVITAGKPRPLQGNGECKTDVYVLGQDDFGQTLELKISVKSEVSSEFQGNKFKPQDAEDLLGVDWKEIVSTATENIAHKFEEAFLIFLDSKGNTQADSITMGWKLEIADKSRGLSAPLPLHESDIRDFVYKGVNQTPEKQNSFVNGTSVSGSGIADYILRTGLTNVNSPEDVIAQMVLIDEYRIEPTFLIFTGNNYRTQVDSTDGKRCLAVIVEWELVNGKLKPSYIYNQPLSKTGHDNKRHVQELFNHFGIQHPSQLDVENMVYDPRIVWKR